MRPNMVGGGAFGNHVLLLTSRKFSLMTSRGNSCSMVTNGDEMGVVRLKSTCASPFLGCAPGWQRASPTGNRIYCTKKDFEKVVLLRI